MEQLQSYYDEHAQQARQHEDQRERVTNIILSISGVLISFITFAELSLGALAASFTLIALGVFGFFFSGKHYERFKFHTAVMKRIRDEIDELRKDPSRTPAPMSKLRQEGEVKHYQDFRWPQFGGSTSEHQRGATSWIARQRVHVFWEAVPLIVAMIGIALTGAIIIKALILSENEPFKVKVVNSGAQQTDLARKNRTSSYVSL